MNTPYWLMTSRFCRSFLVVVLAGVTMASAAPAADEKLTESRVWHGANGKHFRGKFLRRDGETLHILAVRGKIYKVKLSSLSEDDRKWFDKAWAAKEEKATAIKSLPQGGEVKACKDLKIPGVPPIGYARIPDDRLTRPNLPLHNQGDYYSKNFLTFSSSMVPFLLWWHQYKVIHVPSRRDDNERRIKWLYSRAHKHGRSYKSGGNMNFVKFFREDLKTGTCFRSVDLRDARNVHRVLGTYDRCDPKLLSQYVRGANATLLDIKVYEGKSYSGVLTLPLVSCDEKGNMILYMYGEKLRGVMKPVPKKSKRDIQSYEIEIENMGELPDWLQARDYHFHLGGKEANGLFVLIPYLPEKTEEPAGEEDK